MTRFSFREEDWALGNNSMKFWDFSNISLSHSATCKATRTYHFITRLFFIFIFFLFIILRRYKFLIYKFTNSTMNINSVKLSRFLDLRGNLAIVNAKPTRKAFSPVKKKYLAPRIYQAKLCLSVFHCSQRTESLLQFQRLKVY